MSREIKMIIFSLLLLISVINKQCNSTSDYTPSTSSSNEPNTDFDPNDYEKAYDKPLELLEEYKLEFIKKYKKEGMSKNMIIAIDWYGTMKNEWYKNFKNLYNQ